MYNLLPLKLGFLGGLAIESLGTGAQREGGGKVLFTLLLFYLFTLLLFYPFTFKV